MSPFHILAKIKPLACLELIQNFDWEDDILRGLICKVEMHLLTLGARAVQSYQIVVIATDFKSNNAEMIIFL